jgi:uncharacterized BrkB/YihY/UPF0761 family membrane protein
VDTGSPDQRPDPAGLTDPPAEPPPAQPEAEVGPTDVTATGWRRLVAQGRGVVATGRTRAEALLETAEDRPLIDVGLRIYRRDRESAGTVVSSAVAFRLFLFFVPLLLFVVGLVGFLATQIDEDDVQRTGITGSVAEQINGALEQPHSTRWIAVLVGLVGMATTGRTLSKTMVSASCLAWRLPVRPKASPKVTGGIVGLIVGVGLVSLVINRIRIELGIAAAGMSYLLAVAVYVVAWLLVTLMLPRAPSDPSALVPGAVLIAVTMVGMQAFSQLYLPGRFSRASELYGAVGATLVVLGWFFVLGRVIVLALVVDAIIYERFGSISQFVFSLPGLRALPRRSPRFRRFFALDADEEGADDPPG